MTRYCTKCGKMLDEKQFYTSNNLEKYQDGKLNECKDCISMHVDPWDPDTFLWILEEADVPYIKSAWDKIIEKEIAKKGNASSVTGKGTIGRYLSSMKLSQYKRMRWADTEVLAEKEKEAKITAMQTQGFTPEEIEEALAEEKGPPRPEPPFPQTDIDSSLVGAPPDGSAPTGPADPALAGFEPEEDEFADQLTEADKLMLRLKWGKGYTAEQWVRMEQLYNDMMKSYDIQTAGHKDTLIMLCKTSIRANDLLDAGDIDGFQKMQRAYDSLMKSGKFQAAQNKEQNSEYVDSVGELVAMCEREGFIPRYYTDGPQDKIDRTLQDLEQYTRTLVKEETNLENLVNAAVRDIALDREREAHIDVDDSGEAQDEESQLFDYENPPTLTLDDQEEFSKAIEEDQRSDEDIFGEEYDF